MHFAEKVTFNENGEALVVKTIQNKIAIKRRASAWIAGLDARFDVMLQTNKPQRMQWNNIGANEKFGGLIALRRGFTTLEIHIHSSIPNMEAIIHIEA